MKEKSFFGLVTIASLVVPALVAILFRTQSASGEAGEGIRHLPLFHACLNGTTFFLLLLAFYFIRTKKIALHKTTMLGAAGLSAVFLLSYVLYHSTAPQAHYGGGGSLKYVYYFILLTHILLAAIILPFVLITLYRGLNNQFEKHKKIARITFPLWLYVAFTGVLVYIFMAPYYPR